VASDIESDMVATAGVQRHSEAIARQSRRAGMTSSIIPTLNNTTVVHYLRCTDPLGVQVHHECCVCLLYQGLQ
jgi:hypothetical protein